MYKWRKIKRKPKPELAVDFDGVLHKYSKKFYDGTLYDLPVEGARVAMAKLHKKWWLYIYTTRAQTKKGKEEIERWLKKYKIPFDEVVYTKPVAVAYIDDRAIHFDNWEQAILELYKRHKKYA